MKGDITTNPYYDFIILGKHRVINHLYGLLLQVYIFNRVRSLDELLVETVEGSTEIRSGFLFFTMEKRFDKKLNLVK